MIGLPQFPIKFIILVISAGGMNGSIVYELERPENAGLKKPLKACSVSLVLLLF